MVFKWEVKANMKKQKEQLKNNFKGLRVRNGFNQEQVAKHLDVSRTRFVEYENNPATIKIELLLKLAGLYGCKISDFFVDVCET